MTMVEGVEQLGQLEDMLRQIRWFRGGNTLLDDRRSLGGGKPKLPDLVGILSGERSRQFRLCEVQRELIGLQASFAEDAAGADNRILRVWSGLALEAESIFEIERDDGLLGVLQHEVTQSPDGDLRGDTQAFRLA